MSFRRRPSHRKQRRRQARWLVLGHSAAPILHGSRRAILIPVRSGDHPKRYVTGQRLAVKEFVPGPTACHVIVTAVSGLPELYTLGQVDDATARELGHADLESFREHWILNHDTDWYARADEQAALDSVDPDQAKGANELLLERALARFDHRWASKPGKHAWLIRFRLDLASAPRMLAAHSSIYDPEKENDEGRDEDRGYTTSDALALAGEMPALTDTEWERHVGPRSRYREWDRLRAQRRERETRGLTERLTTAKAVAKAKGYDIRDETRRLERLLERGDGEKAKQQLALIEARVFPAAA